MLIVNTNKLTRTIKALLGVGLLCGAGLGAKADDVVTFQVDLSRFTNALGGQAASFVDVRGGFNNWSSGWTLVNNGASVYTNTFTVAGAAASSQEYKFTYTTCSGTTWEDNDAPETVGGGNRRLTLVGGDQPLPVVSFFAPGVKPPINLVGANITIRCDMTEQVQLGSFLPGQPIRASGGPAALTGWGDGVDLTNNPALPGDEANIYSAVVNICGTPGTSGGSFKFRMNFGWEDTSINDDRTFLFTGQDQVLPVYYYRDQPVGPLTNGTVTFRVDMTPQVLTGGFTNGVSTVGIAGNINSWGLADMTNNASLPGTAANIYSTTIPLPDTFTTTVSNWSRFKFRANGGWESAAIYGVGGNKDRRFFITGGDQVLPLVTYNDASLCDVMLQPTQVTISLHLTNGTPDKNGIPFDSANDKVHISGEFIGWPAWNNLLPELTNNPVGSDNYEIVLDLPGGASRRLQYKFGLEGPTHTGVDNESGFQQDHVSYVRSATGSYVVHAEFGLTFLPTFAETQFGNLTIGKASGGTVPVTWAGYPCTTLQTRSSIGSGSWVDLPGTDATSKTNFPAAAGSRFFRLQKRPLP